METKPLSPKDVVGWLFTVSSREALVQNINNRLKFPELLDDNSIEIKINKTEVIKNTGIRLPDNVLLGKLKELYADWNVSIEKFTNYDVRNEEYSDFRYVFTSKTPMFK